MAQYRPTFVSHAHADNTLCDRYVAALTAKGIDVWYDRNNAQMGHFLGAEIQRELERRSAFVLLLTQHSLDSFWVTLETQTYLGLMAKDHSRMLLPVRIGPCDVPPMLNAFFWIDALAQPFEATVNAIAAALAMRDPASVPVAPTPTPITPQDDPATARVRQATPLIESAFAEKDWPQVRDRCRYLKLDAAVAKAMPARLWLLYGQACLEDGETKEGREALEQALQQAPDDLEAIRSAARARHLQGDDAAAENYLLRALGGPVTTTAERLAVLRDYLPVLVKLKHWNEALRRATEGSRLAPEDATWARWQLNALDQLQRPADALAAARTLTGLRGATAGDWIARARLAYAVANNTTTDEVRTALDAAARLAPAHDPALATARRELLPPPPPPPPQRVKLPPDRLPAKLVELGFAAYEQEGVIFILPPLCDVPAGPFMMGSDARRDREAQSDEQPAHEVSVPAFQIARYPVTVAEYACFVRAGHKEPSQGGFGVDWRTQLTRLDHPVTCVSWHDAMAYAAWLAERTGQPCRLPTEAEWEKAARWDAARGVARLYPWGDGFDKARCNTRESGHGSTTPVYAYPNGASPCGAQDMAGNVWEWTSSLFQPYPYSQSDGRDDPNSTDNRVLRGGSWGGDARSARAAYRNHLRPVGFDVSDGFRLAVGSVRAGS